MLYEVITDREGFEAAMEEQRERARSARHDGASMKIQGGVLSDLTTKSEFIGYNELNVTTKIVAIVSRNNFV